MEWLHARMDGLTNGRTSVWKLTDWLSSLDKARTKCANRPYVIFEGEVTDNGDWQLALQKGSEITRVSQIITSRSGMALYQAPDDISEALEKDYFQIIHDYKGSVVMINVTVDLFPVDDPPEVEDTTVWPQLRLLYDLPPVTVASDTVTSINLPHGDEEDEKIVLRLLNFPEHGHLSRSDGVPLTGVVNPTTTQYAYRIPPYSELWGPSWTSQVLPTLLAAWPAIDSEASHLL
eukprot:scaffold647956_cov51-Prasinocladus_malaysianus.AAC.1